MQFEPLLDAYAFCASWSAGVPSESRCRLVMYSYQLSIKADLSFLKKKEISVFGNPNFYFYLFIKSELFLLTFGSSQVVDRWTHKNRKSETM